VRCIPPASRRALEVVIETDLAFEDAGVGVEDRAVGGGETLGAEIDVVDFALGRPVFGEGVFDTVPNRPARPVAACGDPVGSFGTGSKSGELGPVQVCSGTCAGSRSDPFPCAGRSWRR
jgi:hypothetical protein